MKILYVLAGCLAGALTMFLFNVIFNFIVPLESDFQELSQTNFDAASAFLFDGGMGRVRMASGIRTALSIYLAVWIGYKVAARGLDSYDPAQRLRITGFCMSYWVSNDIFSSVTLFFNLASGSDLGLFMLVGLGLSLSFACVFYKITPLWVDPGQYDTVYAYERALTAFCMVYILPINALIGYINLHSVSDYFILKAALGTFVSLSEIPALALALSCARHAFLHHSQARSYM